MRRLSLVLLLAAVAAGVSPALAKGAKKPKKEEVAAPVVEAPKVDPNAWRATKPAPGPEPKWAPPTPITFTLSNGIPVYFLPRQGLPLLSVDVVMQVGREANPIGQEGIGALTAAMLDEGSSKYTMEALAKETGRLGAELNIVAGSQATVVSLDALVGQGLGPSLDVLADVVLHPSFDKAAFARVKAETLDALTADGSDPRARADRALMGALYGARHPYGTPASGTVASVEKLKLKQVKKFYKQWWHAGNAAIVVSGSLTEGELKSMLEARFGGWAKGKSTRVTAAAPSVPMKTQVVFVEQKDAVQSVIRVGTPGPARGTPEFVAAQMAGNLVAGMFSSPINMSLREEHGWSYGAYGAFSESRDYGTFAVRTSVQAEATAPAVQEILRILEASAAKAPEASFLDTGKASIVKALPGSYETNASAVDALSSLALFGLPADGWTKYVSDVNALTGDAVKAQADRYFKASQMVIVVVGPKTAKAKDKDGKETTVDVVQQLQALGYNVEVSTAY